MKQLQQLINQMCPNGVEWVNIGDVAYISDYVSAGSFASLRENVTYKSEPDYAVLVRIADFSSNFDESKFIYIDKHAYNFLSKSNLQTGDIIMSNVGSCGLTFRCPDLQKKMSLAPNAIVIRTSNNSYFYHWFTSNKGQSDIQRITTKSAMPKFNKTQFKQLQIPLPPLAIQTRIVEILDNFSNLTANLTEELALRRKQFEYYREKLLSLDGVEGVILKKLGEVASIYDGTHQTPKYTQSGIPFISVENIRDIYNSHKYISREAFDSYKIKPLVGDVFMTRIGSIGECAVFDKQEDIAYYVSLALIRPKECINSCYVKYLLKSNIGKSELRKRTLVSAVPIKINKDDISKIQIPVPPLATQQSIVSILDKFTALIENIETELSLRQKQYEYYREELLRFES